MRIVVTYAATVCALTTPCVAMAQYVLNPVIVNGQQAKTVTAISEQGAIAGIAFYKPKNTDANYMLVNGKVTFMPGLGDPLTPSPTTVNSIQDNGRTAGIYDLDDSGQLDGYEMFRGKYSGFALTSEYDYSGGPRGVSAEVNRKGHWITNEHEYGYLYQPDLVISGVIQVLSPPCQLPYVVSINQQGVVAGVCNSTIPAIFTYDAGTYSIVFGPASTAAFGGYINNHGDIAGTFQDAQGVLHGFVKRADSYSVFAPPSGATAMAVTGFSDSRVAVGTYTDPSGAFHGFSWHAGHFFELVANPSSGQTVQVTGVSFVGDVAVNLSTSYLESTAFIAHCQGTGC